MDLILILLAIAAIVALSFPFGTDSRGLSDHTYNRDDLWSR